MVTNSNKNFLLYIIKALYLGYCNSFISKMNRQNYLKILVIFSLITLAYAGSIFSEYSAEPSTNKVTIKWETFAETNVNRFIILRSPDDKLFNEIGSSAAKGSGNEYTFVDENVIFKGSQTFFYKIRALSKNNLTIEETESLMVNPNISGIFRTWGAIKAMFR